MSSTASIPNVEPAGQAPVPRRPRTLVGQIVGDTLGRWGARFGAAWIGLAAACAIFAPFIANTHPIVMKVNGEVTWPLLRHLNATDVILLVLTLAAVVLWLLPRPGAGAKLGVFAVIAAVAIPLCLLTVHPPENVNFTKYRTLKAAAEKGGPDAPKVDYMVRTLLPFSPEDYLRDKQDQRLRKPDATHVMGTEINGADVLSRLIHASRVALAIGFVATGIEVLIGVFIGGLMGYFAGVVDMLGMRLVEIFEAIPTLFLILTFVAFFGHDMILIMVILGLTGWTGYARFVRAEYLKLRSQDFVVAARACGLPLYSILFRHMLPNGMAPVLVSISFSVASAILYEATLSFLGLGPVGAPSWGALLEQARSSGGTFYWWVALFPGLAIFLTVFSYNLIGEALRDAVDPHTRKLQRAGT